MPLDHVVGVAVVGSHQPPPSKRLTDLEEFPKTLVDQGAGPRRRGEVACVADLFCVLCFFFPGFLKKKNSEFFCLFFLAFPPCA